MLCGVQRVDAGEGYEIAEKQAAAAGRLRKKAVPLLGARSLAVSVLPPPNLIDPSPGHSRALHPSTLLVCDVAVDVVEKPRNATTSTSWDMRRLSGQDFRLHLRNDVN